ncbi:hypothetical protein [Streptomyces mashuensis]|nr:hypothetical protein [Streptomyces mashuensis]
MPPALRRLLADLVVAGAAYPLVLGGAYALRAHGIGAVVAGGAGLELVTDAAEPMDRIVDALRAGLVERGWGVRVTGGGEPLEARLVVADPAAGTGDDAYTVGLAKETMRQPVLTVHGLTLAVEDAVGLRVRALADRGLAGDLMDVRAAAACGRWSWAELEALGRRHARDAFDLADLQARLEAADLLDDRAFAAQGLDEAARTALRGWAHAWAADIAERLIEEAPYGEEDEV